MPEDRRLDGDFFDDDDADNQQLPSYSTGSETSEFFGSRTSEPDSTSDFFRTSSNDAGGSVGTVPTVNPKTKPTSSPTQPPPMGGVPPKTPPKDSDSVAEPSNSGRKHPAPPTFKPKSRSGPTTPPPLSGESSSPDRKPPQSRQPAASPRTAGRSTPKPTLDAPTTRRTPAPSIPDPYAAIDDPEPTDRKGKFAAKRRHQAKLREQRWANNRLAVPYPTDGPKLTFAVIWFAAILSSVLVSPLATALVGSVIASIAAMQTAQAWFGQSRARWWAATASTVITFSGYFGGVGIIGGTIVACMILGTYMLVDPAEHRRSNAQLFDVLGRSTLPAGLAAGGIVAISSTEPIAAVGLILLVSSYEAGDYLVGSGSRTAAEGPIAGIISLGVMAFVLSSLVPAPYTVGTVVAFAAITAVGALAGQIFASASLPRGVAWAPALRRLDSYIIAAPIWLVLVFLLI